MQYFCQKSCGLLQWGRVHILAILLCLGLGGFFYSQPAYAAATVTNAATEVSVHLGTAADELKFVPNRLEFETGKLYKLVLDNPSPEKHYFTAKDFADAVWTKKVEAGNVEIKGAIRELELRAGTIAEWFFIPQRAGEYSLRCVIPGHTEAGMTGTLIVK